MSDEQQEQNLENDPSLNFSSSESLESTNKEVAANPVEEEAKKFGHKSLEEWTAEGNDPKKWKSPEQFVNYGHEYSEVKSLIKTLRDENKQQKSQLDELLKYHKSNAENTVRQAKAELEARLKQARDHVDLEAVEKLTQQKMMLEWQQKQQEELELVKRKQQVDLDFMERNKHWFNPQHEDLRQKAIGYAAKLMELDKTLSYEDIARRVEERVKFEHPEIVIAAPTQPSISNSKSQVNKSSMSHVPDDVRSFKELSADEKVEYQAVKDMVERVKDPKTGKPMITYTVKEYLESLKRV